MSQHYYEQDPHVTSDEQKFTFVLRGQSLTFLTDRGVFSKKEVDYGSRLLIDTFRVPQVEGDILDAGCGYGPIGLFIAATEDRKVWLSDVNRRALELAKRNAAMNEIESVEILESDRFENIEKQDFAAVVTNPPIRAGKKIVHSLFEEAVQHLKFGGEIWVVIQKKQGAKSAKELLMQLCSEVQTVAKDKGYYIYCGKK